MKLIITEQQVERFAERMAYIDKIIKTQMREGANWEHLAWLTERYGLTQEDLDIIGIIQRNILDSMVGRTIDITDPQFSHILHSDDDFTFTIDKVIPQTITHPNFNNMDYPRFVLRGSLIKFDKRLEEDQTWLDHVLDIMIEMVPESNPILKALGVNIDFDDYPVDYEGKEDFLDTLSYNNLTEDKIPQPGVSSNKGRDVSVMTPITTEYLNINEILDQVEGIPYYKEVLDDMIKKDYSWDVTKKVLEYGKYLKSNPESVSKLPPIKVIDNKLDDGAHRISAIYLLDQLLDRNNPYWDDVQLQVDFYSDTPEEILKEETIKSKRDKIDTLVKRLKKLYPKLDYCIGNDDTLQVYTNYEEADPVTFTETGLIFDPIEPPSDFWMIGNFTDYREIENGEYIDRAVDMVDRSPEDRVIEWLDHEFGTDQATSWREPNYYGEPAGDEPMFDWRNCED